MSLVLTQELETSTRKKIDQILVNLGWNTDEGSSSCNVFTERTRTQTEKSKLKGKSPDYVLYDSKTQKPIAIIEAKRKGQSIEAALKQAEERYALALGVKIIFAYDGAFFKSWHIEEQKELVVDGTIITQLLSEKKLKRFLVEGYSITEETPKIKHTRAELIDVFQWSNKLLRKEGLHEGLERFSEFANLLFLKIISEIEQEREDKGEPKVLDEQYRWSSFAKLDERTMMNYINNTVLPYLVKQYNHSGEVFQKELSIKNPKTLKMIVERLSKITLMDADTDVKGDAFEYFLRTSITLGNDMGEYFTPRHLVNLMVELAEPKFGETVYDPTCGTGGFLIYAFNYIKERCAINESNYKILKEKTLFGREITNTAKIAKMNMIITGDGHNNIEQKDTLEFPLKERYDIVLANPPYGQITDYGSYYPISSNNGDAVFIQHIFMSLKEGGRAAVVIPEGLLFRGGADLKVRQYLIKNANIQAIVSLPPGVFRPYAKGNKTNIIYFEKNKGGTKSIWFYELTADGFDLNSDMRRPVEQNDIPDLLSKWADKPESENSWIVEIGTIEKNNYGLRPQMYKPKRNTPKGQTNFSAFLKPIREKTEIVNNKTYKQITVQLYGKGAVLRKETKGSEIASKSQFIARTGNLIVSRIDARNGALAIVSPELDGAVVSSDFPLFEVDTGLINAEYLDYYLRFGNFSAILEQYAKGTTNRRRIDTEDVLNLTIPLPSLEEQEIIAKRIRAQYKIIKCSDDNLKALRQGLVDSSDFDGDYPLEDLENVCESISSGGTPTRTRPEYFKGDIPWIKISDFKLLDTIHVSEEKITKDAIDNSSAKMLPKGAVLVSIFATIGATCILGMPATTNQAIAGLIPKKDKVINEYLMFYLHTLRPYYEQQSRGVAQNNINLGILKGVKIKVPPITVQERIVATINNRRNLIKDIENRKAEAQTIISEIMKGNSF